MTVGKAVASIFVSPLFLALVLGAPGSLGAQTLPQEAAEFVRTLGNEAGALQTATKAQAPDKRKAALRHLVRRGFNLELTSQFVLGKYWNRATATQRAQFQDLFNEYLLNSYARHLGAYQAETLSVVASRPVGRKDVRVETSIEGVEGAANPVWRVRAEAGQYKIIDVTIEGVSLALTQRREFAAVINRKGLDGLLDMLREKLAAQAKAAQGRPPADDGMKASLFASILASPNANSFGILLALR
jgi:phospholipid transport system substrate-binding protein